MINLKKNSDSEIESLIESMLRLMEYMNFNPSFKRKMFESFNNEDLKKIQKNLNDIRILLLERFHVYFCVVFYKMTRIVKASQNYLIQYQSILKLLQMIFQKRFRNTFHRILQSKYAQFQENSLCWYYAYQMAKEQSTQLQFFFLNYQDIRKSINEFIDPLDSIIGIVYEKQRIYKTITPSSDISIRDKRNQMQKLSVSPIPQTLMFLKKNIKNAMQFKKVCNLINKIQDHCSERKPINYDILRNKILEQQNTRNMIVNSKPNKEIQSIVQVWS
ncbi:unnamed protein product [Paramecium sonneborni]|uniref:Uncharacterized protein n=1 Tax=Paramecium sonneborni TaxID=65129 RepID=A0A8S1QQV5_9CILI|nr:unnamed protein product [Paramecium sonneborni]